MLVPSPEFITRLPFSKIPDRNDFTNLDAQSRLKYWRTVLAESECLADEFSQILVSPDINAFKLID